MGVAGAIPAPYQERQYRSGDNWQVAQDAIGGDGAGRRVPDHVHAEDGDERPEDARQTGCRRGPDRGDHHHHAQCHGPRGRFVEQVPTHGRVRNPEMGAEGLCGGQRDLNDPDPGQRPSPPRNGLQSADRRSERLRRWDRGDGGDLRASRQTSKHLGLLDRRGAPLTARLAGAQVFVDAGGGDRLAFAVDPGR